MGSANERWRYIVTLSLIDWAHTQTDPCIIRADWYQSNPKHNKALTVSAKESLLAK